MATFDPWVAAQAYIATMSPAAQAKAVAYTHTQHWMLLWGFLAEVAVALIILWSGLLRRTRDGLEKNRPRPYLVSLVVVVIASVMSAVLSLPWDIYRDWYVEKSFAMTSQPLGGWMREHLMNAVLGVVGAAIFFPLFYFLLRRARNTWPIWCGALVAVLAGLFLIVAPLFIEPLFNTYTPAPASPMRDAIVTLAKQTGTPSDKIYVYNGSKQSNRYTANVSGVGGSARVAISDVTWKKATVSEMRGVVGHEMGHYVRGHSYFLMAAFGVLAAIVFFLVKLLFPLVSRLARARGVKDIADPAGLPVLNITLSLVMLLATPAMSTITRVAEADADRFSLEHAHDPDGLSAALVKTADYRAPNPTRLEEIVFYDHPSVFHRVYDAMVWKAKHMDLVEQTKVYDDQLQAAEDAWRSGKRAPALALAGPPAPNAVTDDAPKVSLPSGSKK
ncbi:MAG TPA: M48 family metallopeptidase [Caulobacteraceae bacterium]|jgi:STE24 endopeptidase|nr:M48 family metallopeptidase [Caulobacteraceae bacterium]